VTGVYQLLENDKALSEEGKEGMVGQKAEGRHVMVPQLVLFDYTFQLGLKFLINK